MLDILSTAKVYSASWNVKDITNFSDEDKERIKSAEVVQSDYGKSVCLLLVAGGKAYFPLSTHCGLSVGDSVPLDKATWVTLSRPGDNDIYRIGTVDDSED